MTAFTIFVLLLTFGYLVYFAVMITLELHKKEEVQKSDEEVFDVSDMAEQEEPTCIEEHINNEDNGVLTYTDELTDDGIRILNPTSGIQQSSNVNPEMHETTDEPDNEAPVNCTLILFFFASAFTPLTVSPAKFGTLTVELSIFSSVYNKTKPSL